MLDRACAVIVSSTMTVYLINPSHVSFGIGVITPRWLYVLASATPAQYGEPRLVDETLEIFDPSVIKAGDVVGIGIHTGNALRGYEIGDGRACSRRLRRVRRHSRHALSGRGPRPRWRAQPWSPATASRRGRWPSRDCAAGRPRPRYDGGRIERRDVPARTMGAAAAGTLHVGLGADRSRLPEALLVLLRLADRRSAAAAAARRPCARRGRRSAASRIPLHRARRRQLLSGHARGSADGGRGAAIQSQLERLQATRAERFELMAGLAQPARGHGVLHADHDGGRRGSRVPRRDAPGAHQGRARRRRGGDARRAEGHLQETSTKAASHWSTGSRHSGSTACTSSARSSSVCRAIARATFDATLSVAERAGLTFAQFVMLTPFPGTLDFAAWEKSLGAEPPERRRHPGVASLADSAGAAARRSTWTIR